MSFSRRLFAIAGLFILALPLAACFDKEPEQRAAFIQFLQKRIIDRPGLHIPILSEKEIADLGPYADQYRIMSGFHHGLDASINKDLTQAMQIGNPRSLEDLAKNREIIPVIKNGMNNMKAALDKVEGDANTARKALKQPADLKVVYDNAFERMVTKPATVFRELLPMIQTMMPPIEDLANYIAEHRNEIEFRGGTAVAKNNAVRTKLSSLMDAAAKAAAASEEGKRKLRAMAEGR